ncbi:MAG: L-asparaginase 1 [Bacteroidetes bacterium RIFCSPHIGHO2_02_FULL_44_7]|nr:MAG: L-asparaginase 1 [Bacteroidetes bacterium RIFCSPHIGHO2_02_FULL_44_7]
MEARPKVLIIYTGGTIGMIKDAETAQLSNVNFNHIYDHVPELKRLNVELETTSFEHPVDSSEMNTEHWQRIAETIFDNYALYDGFVVLHGSDTMAYTASALSFMFQGLTKPIILTGSQLPIGIIRTDGKENLITAIEIAAARDQNEQAIVQEVAVYFEYKLFRGNRSTKDSAEHFEAFRSPNFPELAVAGVEIKYNWERLFRDTNRKFQLNTRLNPRIALIKLFPGLHFESYAALIDRRHVDGVVLETFGAGNASSSGEIRTILDRFIQSGGLVLNITQCSSGAVQQGLYKSSSQFNEIGVVSGVDMTTEAAVTKMMAVLATADSKDFKQLLGSNLRGELTEARANYALGLERPNS